MPGNALAGGAQSWAGFGIQKGEMNNDLFCGFRPQTGEAEGDCGRYYPNAILSSLVTRECPTFSCRGDAVSFGNWNNVMRINFGWIEC